MSQFEESAQKWPFAIVGLVDPIFINVFEFEAMDRAREVDRDVAEIDVLDAISRPYRDNVQINNRKGLNEVCRHDFTHSVVVRGDLRQPIHAALVGGIGIGIVWHGDSCWFIRPKSAIAVEVEENRDARNSRLTCIPHAVAIVVSPLQAVNRARENTPVAEVNALDSLVRFHRNFVKFVWEGLHEVDGQDFTNLEATLPF